MLESECYCADIEMKQIKDLVDKNLCVNICRK